ncbi:hypothetical protein FHX06_006346 [Rhizobium sp. BK512]|uniref:hypothetical protein n=1 Tax=Rhizobium sp. BK512 TaxID=2587010 RepID=UPI000DE007EC|nr:hypothetical protein [Rhizobium sp. BK512]MBB3564976.1 hypothetical protein [Rhizobium sp. BK512]
MSQNENNTPDIDEIQRLTDLWNSVAQQIPPTHTAAKAPILGFNLRLDVMKALQATFQTAKIAAKVVAATHTPFDPITWIGISIEVWAATQTIIAALVQKMQPIDYISYVILSQSPEGIEAGAFKEAVAAFVEEPDLTVFAPYLGMTEEKAMQAAEVIKQTSWFETATNRLQQNNMARVENGRWYFQARNFTLRGEG